MVVPSANDTDELLDRAGLGDDAARQQLLERHRDRLRRMVALRLDRRLAARVDPSDVVQESLAEAARSLSDYLSRRPLPFYAWLRQFAWERIAKLHRHHIGAQRRSVTREEAQAMELPDESVRQLARRLLANGTSPSQRLVRDENRDRLRSARRATLRAGSRGPGPARPGAALSRRGRRRSGDYRTGCESTLRTGPGTPSRSAR